ncbi:MAG TPA: hypothetical protein DEP35_12865 [Deltaproteobacteria bacterium]|nr:hypothetical protein [Deltaproteobacteria bacterium]
MLFAGPRARSRRRPLASQHLPSRRLHTPHIARDESLQTNVGLVAAGLGVSLVPASIRNLRRAGVVYRSLAPPVPHVEMAAAYLREDTSEITQAFLGVLRQSSRR